MSTSRKRATVVLAAGLLAAAAIVAVQAESADYATPDCSAAIEPNVRSIAAFLHARCYESQPGWKKDIAVRRTGPVFNGQSFSVHGDVRVHYPPVLYEWLKAGRPKGDLPDGTLVVKEQYSGDGDARTLGGWTFMLRDAASSHAGWQWGYVDAHDAKWDSASAYVGYCVACHASADNDQLLYVSLSNIEGRPVDYAEVAATDFLAGGEPAPPKRHGDNDRLYDLPDPLKQPDPAFLALFPQIAAVPVDRLAALPPADGDDVVPPADITTRATHAFVTSSVCGGCHDADSLLSGNSPSMLVPQDGHHLNLSPFGEWGASVMGLAGRDPVFLAQLESEHALQPDLGTFIDNTCFTCHGVMGKRQVEIDSGGTRDFALAMLYAGPGEPNFHYGALARDGVSCAACHAVSPEGLGTAATFTGQFNIGKPTEIFGPYDKPLDYSMKQAIGMTPMAGAQIKDSALCGSCHTVILPILDSGKPYARGEAAKAPTGHEQTTYLEWLNSAFQTEQPPFDLASWQSCQDCHMPDRLAGGQPLALRIANIEDERYPFFEHQADDSLLALPKRSPYGRHSLGGINLFVMSMYQQFADLLGVRTTSPNIAGSEDPVSSLLFAAQEGLDQARSRTAALSVGPVTRTKDALEATVTVRNLAGHKFPSGVGFRRAFLEVTVLDAAGAPLWSSGRPDALGVILGADGRALATELSRADFQPHHRVIDSQDEAQIFETRHRDTSGGLTTSFLALHEEVKDNRLLPLGWSAQGPHAEVTAPIGVGEDPGYADGSGSSTLLYRIPAAAIAGAVSLKVALHYQAIPPYYLQDRFAIAQGPETTRLHHIASRLDLKGTGAEGWVVTVAETDVDLR